MFPILQTPGAAHNAKTRKVTCLTGQLKKCLGHCRFEVVGKPGRKAA